MGTGCDRTRDPWICNQTCYGPVIYITALWKSTLSYLSLLFPEKISPTLLIGPVHFHFKGCQMVFFIFI